MRVNFLLIFLNSKINYLTDLNTTLIIFVIHMIPNMSPYILLGYDHPHT
jgi:hypothetical protein